jgi:hypothetical protein
MVRQYAVHFVTAAALLAVACGGGGGETATDAPSANTGTPPAAAIADAAPAPEPATVADIFPPGPAKAQVLNSCASCHNVACAAIGQRTAERWNALKDSHRENVANADLDLIFAYLSEHFGADKPQPNVPPAFLEGGCTPF